jgi:hypothetical protein
MDIAFTRQATSELDPIERPQNTGVCTLGTDGLEYHGIIEEIYELSFYGSKPLCLVMFKCHWFNPRLTKRSPNIGQVEIRHDSVHQEKDVFYCGGLGRAGLLFAIRVPRQQGS